jgi:MFS family permease
LKGEWAEAKGDRFDIIGSVLYGITIAAIVYGLTILPSISGIWSLLIGILGIFVFVWWEAKTTSPIFNIALFRNNRVFVFSNLAALINYSATFAVTFLLSLYLQYIKGLSPQNAGLILVSMPAVQAILSPIAGRLSDRIQSQIVASLGMSLTTLGLGLLIFLDSYSSNWFIVAALAILGFGLALFVSPNTNAIMSSIHKRFYSIASATLATARQIGMTFSMGITMLVFALYIGRVEITPEYYLSFLVSVKIAFMVFTGLCFSGIFASLARGKLRHHISMASTNN